MSPCFTFTHKSKFTNSRTKIYNFTFTQVPCFTYSRVKNYILRFHDRKEGRSRVHANHWGAPFNNEINDE